MQQLSRHICVFLSGVLVLAVLGPSPAGAVPATCPQAAGVWTCALSDGATSITVEAPGSFLPGPEELVDWAFGSEHLVYAESLFFFSGSTPGGFTPLATTVDGATVDSATGQIVISLAQTGGAFGLVVTYQLTETLDGATLDKSLTLTAGPEGLLGRIYSYHDFDIDLSPASEDTAESTLLGTLVQRGAASSFPNLELTTTAPPDAWQIDTVVPGASLGDSLAGGNAVELDNTPGVVGPGDIESAFSWDLNLDPDEPVTGSLQHTVILTPEPSAGLLGWVACAVLSVARRSQRESARLL